MTPSKGKAMSIEPAALAKLQADCGLPHMPTELTYHLRHAVSGIGPLAYEWLDKPHRLLYDACGEVETMAARVAELEAEAQSRTNILAEYVAQQNASIAELEAENARLQSLLIEADEMEAEFDLLRKALVEHDAADAKCPVRKSNKYVAKCPECMARPSQSCGLMECAGIDFIAKARAALKETSHA